MTSSWHPHSNVCSKFWWSDDQLSDRSRGRVLAYGHWGPGFESWSKQKFLLLSSHQFSTSDSVTLTLDIGLFYLSIFPAQFAKLTTGYFFSPLPLLSSSVCKLYKAYNCSFCLYSLSLSLLEPSIQYETVALRLQWRETKKSSSKVPAGDVL